eukprot:3171606-Pyramimonas_sp.AAC.1
MLDEIKRLSAAALHDSTMVYPVNTHRLNDHLKYDVEADMPSTVATLKSLPGMEAAHRQLIFVDTWGKLTKSFAKLKLSVLNKDRKDRAINQERVSMVLETRAYLKLARDVIADIEA